MVEIAFRKHGEACARKTFKSDAAFQRWMDEHEDEMAEVRVADDAR